MEFLKKTACYKAIPKTEVYPLDKFTKAVTRIVYGSNVCLHSLNVI